MKCPDCNGTGEKRESYQARGGDSDTWTEWRTVQCETCAGVGAVIERSEWVPKWSNTCGSCNGSGKVYEEYVSERYPSGKAAKYGKRKVTCSSCKGRGSYSGGGCYIKTYRPDYKARKRS